jgi:cell division protein FtsI (penicillin-binding protein 3)
MNRQRSKSQVDKLKGATAAWRFYGVLGLIVVVYLGLLSRAAYIQVIEPEGLQKQGDMRSLRTMEKDVQRGSILDRHGDQLAISVPVQTVWADPKRIITANALKMTKRWQALADVLGRPVDELMARIGTDPKKRFVYLQRQLSPAMANYIKALKIPGIHLRKESKRFYPAGEISAHIIGFTNVDDQGIEGVERLYDELLTGTNGQKQFRKDAKGRKIEILAVEEPQPPKNITLSIDQRIQSLAYRELKGAVKAFNATSGSVVVTDVNSGEILALVNSPSYNPNNRQGVAQHRFRNRAITDIYEPGSTMKPLAVLTALEFGTANAETILDTSPGWMRLGGRRVSDPINRGELTLSEVLEKSSNMGTAKLALSVPKAFLLDKFFEMGFADDTGTGLMGESSGMLSDRQRWSKFELATLSFGYGLAVTPLQLARFYSAVANGGVKLPLSILKTTNPAEGERILSEQSSADVLAMLEHVVDVGAPKAQVAGYRVAGKTGTSRKAVAGGYGDDYVGLFAGVAPVSNPQVAVVVVINEPGGDLYHGGEVAAPVFSRIMAGTLQYLNVVPDAHTRVVKVDNSERRHTNA